jgi:hypothetical protein
MSPDPLQARDGITARLSGGAFPSTRVAARTASIHFDGKGGVRPAEAAG